MAIPFGALKYLYVGSDDTARDLAYYRDVLGSRVVWDFQAFGAHVAAVEVGQGPLLLLADHRGAPSVMPVYVVEDLEATAAALRGRSWQAQAGPFEIPDGPCYTFRDPSGNELAFFQNDRPDALLAAHADPDNPRAVRGPTETPQPGPHPPAPNPKRQGLSRPDTLRGDAWPTSDSHRTSWPRPWPRDDA